MQDTSLLPDLIFRAAERAPDAPALTYGKHTLNYGELQDQVARFASGLIGLGLQRGERVAIYLEKRFETVIASFGAPAAGGVFVEVVDLTGAGWEPAAGPDAAGRARSGRRDRRRSGPSSRI